MDWSAYEYQPGFILGFHGCDAPVGKAILNGEEEHLWPSENEYDWLGNGIYFWEGNPSRALSWARQRCKKPFVLGAIIDLKRCLDLFDQDSLEQVKDAYEELLLDMQSIGEELPQNVGVTPDKLVRKLDCAVINWLHSYREARKEPPYDSVRAPFFEGERLYPDAGFRKQNHIQICVRNLECIKGYFRPIQNVCDG